MRKAISVIALSFIVFFLAGFFSPAVQAQDAKDFYKGKTILILLQYSPGGSFDIRGRWLSRHLGKYTGSKVVVENVPGGGGVIGTNKLSRKPPDGLTLMNIHAKQVGNSLFGRKGVKYDHKKLTYVGHIFRSNTGLVVGKNVPAEIEKLRGLSDLRVGASTPFSEGLFAESLGLPNMRVIPGYGLTERIAGIRRGELEASTASSLGAKKFSDAVTPAVFVREDQTFGDTPSLDKLNARDPWKSYMKAFLGMMFFTVASPGVPQDRVEFLQSALQSVVNDKKAQDEAKRLGILLKWEGPEELKELMKGLDKLDKKERQELKYIMEKKYVRKHK